MQDIYIYIYDRDDNEMTTIKSWPVSNLKSMAIYDDVYIGVKQYNINADLRESNKIVISETETADVKK